MCERSFLAAGDKIRNRRECLSISTGRWRNEWGQHYIAKLTAPAVFAQKWDKPDRSNFLLFQVIAVLGN